MLKWNVYPENYTNCFEFCFTHPALLMAKFIMSFVVSSQCTVWIFLTCLIPKFSVSLRSLSNNDDESNKNVTNLHIWQWKTVFFARFARAFFIFWHFEDVLVLSTTWNDLFCSWVDDVSLSWQMLNFVFFCPKRWLQFNPRIVRTHFLSIMTLSNWVMIAEPRSYIFRWRSRFRRRRFYVAITFDRSLSVGSCLWFVFHLWSVVWLLFLDNLKSISFFFLFLY